MVQWFDTFISYLGVDVFAGHNTEVRRFLGVDGQREVTLRIENGFFITPKDKLCRFSKLEHLEVPQITAIDVFARVAPEVAAGTIACIKAVERQPEPDFQKFRNAMIIAYFFAAAEVVKRQRLVLTDVATLFGNDVRASVDRDMKSLVWTFISDYDRTGQPRTLWKMYDFAKAMILETSPAINISTDKLSPKFDNVAHFMNAGYNPYAGDFGKRWEQDIQDIFEVLLGQHALKGLIESRVGKPCIIIPFDRDLRFKALVESLGKRKIPDYLCITQDSIVPIDLKAGMRYATEEQVSADNFSKYFRGRNFEHNLSDPKYVSRMTDQATKEICALFSGVTVQDKKGAVIKPAIVLDDKGNELK